LVVVVRQEQVGALPGGELNKGGEVWRATPSFRDAFGCGEGFAYCLDQHTLQFEGSEQGLECGALVGFSGILGRLGQRHSQLPGSERHLGDKASNSIGAITDQLVELHPLKKVEEGRITWCL
jgi:hypothetical protein